MRTYGHAANGLGARPVPALHPLPAAHRHPALPFRALLLLRVLVLALCVLLPMLPTPSHLLHAHLVNDERRHVIAVWSGPIARLELFLPALCIMERPLSPRPASTDGSAFRPVGESQHSPFVPPPGSVHPHHGRKGSDGTESVPPLRSQIRSFLQSPAVRDMSVGRNALALQQLRPIGIKRASTGKKPTTKKRRVRESESDVGECEDDDDVASSTDEKEKKEEGKQVSERVVELEDQVRKLQMEVLEARQKAKMEEDTMRAVFQKRKEALNKVCTQVFERGSRKDGREGEMAGESK